VTIIILIWTGFTSFGRTRIVTTCMLVVATVLFSVPAIESYRISRNLPNELTKAFGPVAANSESAPFDFWRLWHASKPKGITLQKLKYTTKDGELLALDFYSNASSGVRPCVVIVHGGSWRSGNQDQLLAWNYILAGSNYRVAEIAYRLAPQSHWPAQKEDLLEAIAYLKTNATALGIDPTHFVLLGRSAGAQIILATAYSAQDTSIRGCIASYPPSDMDFDYGPAASHSLLNAHELISDFLGGTPDQVPDVYRDASPCQLVGPNSPPTLITQGTRDELVWIENSRKLRNRLLEARRMVFLLELPWATHGFDVNPSGPGGQLELYSIKCFLKSVVPEQD
jgi:acetyl esterase/lipase